MKPKPAQPSAADVDRQDHHSPNAADAAWLLMQSMQRRGELRAPIPRSYRPFAGYVKVVGSLWGDPIPCTPELERLKCEILVANQRAAWYNHVADLYRQPE